MCFFFFISLTFSCICEEANDSLTGMLSGRRWWSISLFLRNCVCVGVLSGRDRHTLHVLLETGAPGWALVHDSCLSLLSSLHLTPDRPSLLPLPPHPLPPYPLFLHVWPLLTALPLAVQSDGLRKLVMPVALFMWWCVVWQAQTLSGRGNSAVQPALRPRTRMQTHTPQLFCSAVRNSIHHCCQALDQTCIKKRAPWLAPTFSLSYHNVGRFSVLSLFPQLCLFRWAWLGGSRSLPLACLKRSRNEGCLKWDGEKKKHKEGLGRAACGHVRAVS